MPAWESQQDIRLIQTENKKERGAQVVRYHTDFKPVMHLALLHKYE